MLFEPNSAPGGNMPVALSDPDIGLLEESSINSPVRDDEEFVRHSSRSVPMSPQPLVEFASRTDVGMRRAANQDSLAVRLCSEYEEWVRCGHLFAVADGMGGHAVGDLASRITVETLPHAYFKLEADSVPERLQAAIMAANKAIHDKAQQNSDFTDMGTTCSVLALASDGAYAGHVGDSRVYRVRGDRTEQLTFDHSLQWEMIRQGRATVDNVDLLHPRNVITRCLGPEANVNIDIEGPFDVRKGDRFVICSDGLTGHVSDTEIGAIVANLPPAESSRLLINLANCRGGADNTTVVVTDVEDYPPVSGPVVDSPTAIPPNPKSEAPSSSLGSQISLGIFAVLASFGLIFLLGDKRVLGIVLICVAVLQGFVRLIIAANRRPKAEPETLVSQSSGMHLAMNQIPADCAPYRVTSTALEPELLEFLAEAQSELTQAGHENGWNLDAAQLSELNRQSLAAVKGQKPERCLRYRAKAIDILMTELYAQTRK